LEDSAHQKGSLDSLKMSVISLSLTQSYQADIGDVLAVFDVGAYGMAMSSHYNLRSKPVEVAFSFFSSYFLFPETNIYSGVASKREQRRHVDQKTRDIRRHDWRLRFPFSHLP